MAATTIRVSAETHRRIGELARRTGQQMQAVVEEAVAAYERDRFWDDFAESWERLADDADAQADLAAERAAWDATTRDGLG